MALDFETVLDLMSDEDQLVHLERLAPREARHGTLARPLPDRVDKAIGIDRLWVHQAQAIDAVRAGRSVVVATGTASGKSLCYQAPIAEAVVEGDATALLVFPTKALAQDQLRALTAFGLPGLVAATYDGDTGPEARTWVRRNANVILTNPEMLHGSLLPFHARWATFLRSLRYVVIDELHVLRGVFGTHVGHVLRRLRRLCALYGASPTFVFSSATIGDPAALASALCGLPVEAITDDGSPRGERLVALWNPPLIDEEFGVRGSAHVETERLMAALVGDHRTVAFCRSRRTTELVAAGVRQRIDDTGGQSVRSYRAGYLAAERREIEEELFSGRLRGVVATSALELGVDIGGLDACVLDGFPGTIASMWQQIGRAGREHQQALAVLVAGTDQLDQWLMAHPRETFLRTPEPAVVNLTNPFVAHPHLCSAAFEHPLTEEDEQWWGSFMHEAVLDLVRSDRLRARNHRAFWNGRGSPAPGIGLRSGTSDEYRIVDADDGRTIGTVDGARAFDTVHDGAIYLHQGQQYRVQKLDVPARAAIVTPDFTDEYTQVRSEMDIEIVAREQLRAVGRAQLAVGRVEVTSRVVGYERRTTRSREVISREQLDLPPSTLPTRALWYTIDDELIDAAGLTPDRVPGTLHAVEHAAIGILPLFTICDRWDVGGISIAYHGDTDAPTIFIYDGYPGGAGIADLGFGVGVRHLAATLAVIERCRCSHGCPSCVQSPKCGNGNDPLDKSGAVALLRTILN